MRNKIKQKLQIEKLAASLDHQIVSQRRNGLNTEETYSPETFHRKFLNQTLDSRAIAKYLEPKQKHLTI